jgi:hypothetical protein
MRVTVTAQERQLVERLLLFANTKKFPSSRWVENLYAELGFIGRLNAKGQREFQSLNPNDDPAVEPVALESYRGHQAQVVDWLAAITSGKLNARSRVGSELIPLLSRTVEIQFNLDMKGRLESFFVLAGMEAVFAFSTSIILNSAKGLLNRLGRCDAPKCGKFNLTFEGRPRRYCSKAHRRKADLAKVTERVKAWRKAQKKKRLTTKTKEK